MHGPGKTFERSSVASRTVILQSFHHYIKMATHKRQASGSGDNDRQSKITKASHAKDTGLEQVLSEECFQVQVKAEYKDPKPLGYWKKRLKALLRASTESLDVTEESAIPVAQPMENDNMPTDSDVASR